MDYLDAFAISASGMSVERLRLDVAARNLAHMHTTAATGEPLYQPQRVFATALQRAADVASSGRPAGVQVQGLVTTAAPPRLMHDPGHPAADERGMVRYPGVDHLQEMAVVMSSLRAYEANVAALNAAKTMAARALEIGGQ